MNFDKTMNIIIVDAIALIASFALPTALSMFGFLPDSPFVFLFACLASFVFVKIIFKQYKF